MELSKRLQAVADLVTEGASVADIGTDHGYIPIYLIEHHIAEKVIALDINRGPLERARMHIVGHGLKEKIETRLSDGLEKVLPGEVDTMIAAGMGGGIAYFLDEDGTFSGYCNKEIVLLEQLKEINDTMQLQKMILKHAEYTGSSIARRILADWDSYVKKFVKVIPKDYKRVTEKVAQYLQSGMSEQEATIKVFEEVQA